MSQLNIGPIQIWVSNKTLDIRIIGKRGEPETEAAFKALGEFVKNTEGQNLPMEVMKCRTRDNQGREPDAIAFKLKA